LVLPNFFFIESFLRFIFIIFSCFVSLAAASREAFQAFISSITFQYYEFSQADIAELLSPEAIDELIIATPADSH